MESRLEYRKVIKWLISALHELDDRMCAALEGVRADQVEEAVETLHIAKHLTAAKDPKSNLSEHIRNIDRARRQDHGRPRKRSKK